MGPELGLELKWVSESESGVVDVDVDVGVDVVDELLTSTSGRGVRTMGTSSIKS